MRGSHSCGFMISSICPSGIMTPLYTEGKVRMYEMLRALARGIFELLKIIRNMPQYDREPSVYHQIEGALG